MIDFNSLKCIVNNKYSFVGIEKRQGMLYFYLPKGFTNEINRNDKFNTNRKLFFLFHKIYNTFKEICVNKGYLDPHNSIKKQGRDGLISSVKGAKINDDGNELENIFYSKLNSIDNLINIYDEPRILSLAYRLGNSDKVDISHIHKYLHKAMYLSNHTAYVDQIFLQKRSMQYQATDIVTMYCYLLCEVKHQLNEKVNSEIESLADQFQYQYLGCDGSLFNEQSYSQVLDILKDTLEQIDCNTPIKDTDYWQYYDSINSFLYGDLEQIEDGKIWGISNFYNVWESMCLTYLTQYTDPSYLLRLDTQYVSSKILEKLESVSKIIDLSNSLTTTDRVPLIPDAVVLSLITSEDKFVNGYKIQADRHWNDNLYQTIFKDIDEMHDIKIGYICQKQISHTTDKLDRLYKKDKDENLIIDTLLPKKFYSFWNIPESIDFKYIHKMCYFNHLFYIALEREIITWESF